MSNKEENYSLLKWQVEAYKTADINGFHEDRSVAKRLALIHSEVSEALEADRKNDKEEYAEELADIFLRLADTAEIDGIDLAKEVAKKNEKNRHREYKHGKEY